MSGLPEQVAAAWIFDDRERVLLIRENYDRRRYGPPGGKVEPGESPWEAVVREVYEETCARFEPEGLVGVYHFFHADGAKPPWLAFAFHGSLEGDPRLPDTAEIAELDWFDPDAIPRPVTNLARHGFDDARARLRGVYRRAEAR